MPTFDFISNRDFRQSLEEGHAELSVALEYKATKSVVVLSGSDRRSNPHRLSPAHRLRKGDRETSARNELRSAGGASTTPSTCTARSATPRPPSSRRPTGRSRPWCRLDLLLYDDRQTEALSLRAVLRMGADQVSSRTPIRFEVRRSRTRGESGPTRPPNRAWICLIVAAGGVPGDPLRPGSEGLRGGNHRLVATPLLRFHDDGAMPQRHRQLRERPLQ